MDATQGPSLLGSAVPYRLPLLGEITFESSAIVTSRPEAQGHAIRTQGADFKH